MYLTNSIVALRQNCEQKLPKFIKGSKLNRYYGPRTTKKTLLRLFQILFFCLSIERQGCILCCCLQRSHDKTFEYSRIAHARMGSLICLSICRKTRMYLWSCLCRNHGQTFEYSKMTHARMSSREAFQYVSSHLIAPSKEIFYQNC